MVAAAVTAGSDGRSDDQADFYESSAWLTAEEREQNRKKAELEEERLNRGRGGATRVHFDFAGRELVMVHDSDASFGMEASSSSHALQSEETVVEVGFQSGTRNVCLSGRCKEIYDGIKALSHREKEVQQMLKVPERHW